MQKQILIGLLSGLFVTVLIIIFLGGKRTELESLIGQNSALQADVNKGIQLKANAEKLRVEVEQQQKIIDELIRLMPTDGDRAEIFYKIKKVADGAGIDQVGANTEAPNKSNAYYTEWPTAFKFKVDFHSFGQFASLISGYDKIITIGDIQMKREKGNGIYSANVACKIIAYIYNPEPPPDAAAPAKPVKSTKPAGRKGEE